MSTYAINRMCHQLMHDKNWRNAMQVDPERAIATLDLTDEERRLVLVNYTCGAPTHSCLAI